MYCMWNFGWNSIVFPCRMGKFRSLLGKLFKDTHTQSQPVSVIIDYLAKEEQNEPFTQEEIDIAIQRMMDDNQVMLSDEIVFLIWKAPRQTS